VLRRRAGRGAVRDLRCAVCVGVGHGGLLCEEDVVVGRAAVGAERAAYEASGAKASTASSAHGLRSPAQPHHARCVQVVRAPRLTAPRGNT
jgi:hypothetical protein